MRTPNGSRADGSTPRPRADAVSAGLEAARGGDTVSWNALYARVYDALHRLAHRVRGGRTSVPTVEGDWRTARAWLARALAVDAPERQA